MAPSAAASAAILANGRAHGDAGHEAGPIHHSGGRGGKQTLPHELPVPPEAVIREIDQQELNRMFVRRWGCQGSYLFGSSCCCFLCMIHCA